MLASTHQLVCYTELSLKASLETGKGHALSKNTWQVIGRTICLSTCYRRTSTKQPNPCQRQLVKAKAKVKTSFPWINVFQCSSDITDSIVTCIYQPLTAIITGYQWLATPETLPIARWSLVRKYIQTHTVLFSFNVTMPNLWGKKAFITNVTRTNFTLKHQSIKTTIPLSVSFNHRQPNIEKQGCWSSSFHPVPLPGRSRQASGKR